VLYVYLNCEKMTHIFTDADADRAKVPACFHHLQPRSPERRHPRSGAPPRLSLKRSWMRISEYPRPA
jgi:hypothetical protein